jgi:outer membrane protein assembly factor BamB
MRTTVLVVSVGLTVAATIVSGQQSADWPQWRGLNRDGAAASFADPSSWPEALRRRWKVEVGLGYAAPITVGDRVFMFTRQEPNEVLRAIDAGTGKTVWEATYPAPFAPNPAATRTHGTGPKSTPTFANGRLYTLGMSGIVTAFDAATGRQMWQKPKPAVEPLYHTAMSPLVDGGLVIVHVGGHNNGALTAFEEATGKERWAWRGDGPAYGSPVAVDLAGTRQIVTLTQEHLVGVSAATGDLLWKRPFSVRATRNAATPIVFGETIIVSGLEKSVTGFRVARRGTQWITEDVWENAEVTMDMSTGVIVGRRLFGFSPRNSGQFFALDADTGKTVWLSQGRQAANAAVVRAGASWLALADHAELLVLRADADGFAPLRRYTVAESATWAQPVVSGRRIFVKDVSSLTLWTLN